MKRLFAVLAVMLIAAGCTTPATLPKTDFLGAYAQKLTPGPVAGSLRWLKPGVDFRRYSKFMVDYVVFSLAEDSEYKYIEGDEMKSLGDAASLAMVSAINKKFPVVAEPGPDVMRVRVAIVGLKQSSPVVGGVTTVIPVGLGISVIKKGATGSWSGAGATQAEVLFIDSLTNEVVGAGFDNYSAGFTERFSKWGSVEDAFQHWATRGVQALENIKKLK
jgi:hypothetical protein